MSPASAPRARSAVAPHAYRGPIRAVVLDWAGTTIDHGSRAPALAFVRAFARCGVALELAEARGPMGRAKREHVRALLETPRIAQRWRDVHCALPDAAAADRVYEAFSELQQAALLECADLVPGTAAAVAECERRGVAVAATTGYVRPQVDLVERLAAHQGYVPRFTVTATDVTPGRPAPFLLFEAARRLGVYPMAALVAVDDTEVGVLAARHAGCWSVGAAATGNAVGLSREEWDALPLADRRSRLERARRSLRAAGAHRVLDGIAGLPALLDEIDDLVRRGVGPHDEARVHRRATRTATEGGSHARVGSARRAAPRWHTRSALDQRPAARPDDQHAPRGRA